MKNLSRLFLTTTLGAVLLGFAPPPLNAAGRVGASAFDGSWSVAIYTLRGDCGSVRAAVRIVGGRVYSEDQSYQAGWPSPVLADPQRARAGCRAIPAREVGGHLEGNAPALGRPRAVQAITESDGQSRAPPQGPASIDLSEALCS